MAKGVLIIAIAVCLVASSYQTPGKSGLDVGGLLGPVTGALNAVTGAVGGVANGLTGAVGPALGAVTGALGGVTDALSGVLKGLLDAVLKLVEALLKIVIELLNVILNLVQSLLQVPLQVVNQLLGSLNGLLKPSNVRDGVQKGLAAQIAAAKDLQKQLGGSAVVTQCLVNEVSANISAAVLKASVEIIVCANPNLKNANEAAAQIAKVIGSNGDLGRKAIAQATKCAQENAKNPDPSKILGCLVDPALQEIVEASLLVNATSPIIKGSLGNALSVSACADKILNKEINKSNALLEGVVKCASQYGVNATLPKLPACLLNFSAVAERALSQIEELSSAVIGPNGPINDLLAAVKKVQASLAGATPLDAQTAVNNSVAGVQAGFEAIKQNPNVSSSTDPGVAQCIANAQNEIDKLAQEGLQRYLDCSIDLPEEAAELVKEAVALDVELKKQSLGAGVEAFANCSKFGLAVDNSASNCFEGAVNEIRSRYNDFQKQINDGVDYSNDLRSRIRGCIVDSRDNAAEEGADIINNTRNCLAKEGVVVSKPDLSSAIVNGENQTAKVAANLNETVPTLTDDSAAINGTVEFIEAIDDPLVQSIVSPTILSGKVAVAQTRSQLKNNKNPAVAACLNASEGNLNNVEKSVLAAAKQCVESNLTKAKQVAKESAEQLAEFKDKLKNAVPDAVAECNQSVSVEAANNCFANANSTLTNDARRARETSAVLVADAEVALDSAVICTNGASNDAAIKTDAELASLKSCLAAQGVNVNINRS